MILSGRGVTKLLALTPLGRYSAWLPYPHMLKCSVSLVIDISCPPSVGQGQSSTSDLQFPHVYNRIVITTFDEN